jgi:hypothetical protein
MMLASHRLDGDDGSSDQNDTAIYCRRLMHFCDTMLSRPN